MAEKLRILASFEPHIDSIDNQLLVAPLIPAQPLDPGPESQRNFPSNLDQ